MERSAEAIPPTRDTQSPPALVDVVDTWAEADALAAPPLIVREGLRETLGDAHLPEVERIDAGHSNPTFLVVANGARWILRRPPRPPFAATAHDVLREHRVLSALRAHDVRIPTPGIVCSGPARIGAPFYLMEALDGLVLRDHVPPPLDTPGQRAQAGAEMVDALAELHAIDPKATGLGSRGQGDTYLKRQLALWSGQWKQRRTRPIPAINAVTQRLRERIPTTQRAAVVHGDYKLDNVLFAPTSPPRLVAILDWEMATVGDPLADVGYFTATWIGDGEAADRMVGLSGATSEPGFPSRSDLAARYAQRSGLDLEDLAWYQGLALWKLAILLESSYARFLSGTAADTFFGTLENGVPLLAEQALGACAGDLL
jgi:aminoglycoside phosphotransferase (APT) family kinase protein